MKKPTKQKRIKLQLPPRPAGRAFMVIGPNCWGKGATVPEAEKNAKENFSRSYSSAGWAFMVFDVPEGAWVDGMGSICYDIPEGQTHETCQSFELARFNMLDLNAPAIDRSVNDECPKCSKVGEGPLCKDHRKG